MNRLFSTIIALVLTLSTLYGSLGVSINGKTYSSIMNFAEESEGEIESIDFRLFKILVYDEDRIERSKEEGAVAHSENLFFVNYPEVPIPPPKRKVQ